MGIKSDLAHKLRHDLRLRKERIAAAQNSDVSGNSGQIIEGSGEKNTLERQIGPTIGSTHKGPGTSQATNEIVPQGRGHHLRQTRDFSKALSYAFDGGRKLKSANFKSDGTQMGFLQQIDDGPMQESRNMQSQSTNRFPTLTHLDINEIAKGAQKLSRILKARSLGLNIDKGSTEIGKDLWKVAMELEQSLKMLVNLQEASEKSSLKLVDGGDSEDDSPISTEKPKQLERPVFSFDKASKNRNGNTETSMKQKLRALTDLNKAPDFKPENQVPITSKGSSRHSPTGNSEFQSSQHTNSSQLKHNTGKIPNVIAKLMGLEELAKDINKKIATESQTNSKQRSCVVVSTKNAYRSQVSAEVKTKYVKNAEMQYIHNGVQSNKITIMKSHRPEPPKETYRVSYNCSYRSTANPLESKWNAKDREAIKNHVLESQEAIVKINELQSQITQIKHNNSSSGDNRKEIGVTRQKEQAMDDIEALQTTVEAKKQSSEAVDENEVQELTNYSTHEIKKRAAKKPLLKQKQKRESQLQQPKVLSVYGTHGKMLKLDARSQQRTKRSELEISERKSKSKKSQNLKADINKLIKQPPVTQHHTVKEKTAKANALSTSEVSEDGDRNEVRASDASCISSDAKQKSSVSLEPEQNSSSTEVSGLQTQACFALQADAKLVHVSATKVLDDIKPSKIDSQATENVVMTQDVKTTTKIATALNTIQPILRKGVERSSISRASRGNGSMSEPKQNIPEKAKPSTQASQQQVDAEQISTKNNTIGDESHCKEIVFALPRNGKNQDTKLSSVIVDQHDHHTVPDEIQEVKTQRTTTDGCNDSRNILYDLRPTQPRPIRIEKQDQLTEDEVYLKQKVMMSNLFLNTAEALFKLNIPISVLNYANNQLCQVKDSQLILDCSFEVLKRKGRNQEVFSYPCININTSHTMIRSLNDLVRQLHKDFETLRSYGRNGGNQYDYADYVLQMLKRDIHYNDPDLNSMWDIGWKEVMFAYIEMDEVIRDAEQEVLEELLDEIANDFMLSS